VRIQRLIALGRRKRGLAAAALVAAVAWIALGATVDSRAAPSIRVQIESTGQADLLASDGLRLQLMTSGRARVRARVRSFLKLQDGRRVALTGARTVVVKRKRRRTVTLPLAQAGRAALATCPAAKVRVTVHARRPARRTSFSAPLRLEPPACGRFFAPDTFWNTPLPSDAPLDPSSDTLSAELVRQVSDGYSSGRPPTINTTSYTPPIYTAGAKQPPVAVHLDRPAGYAPSLADAFAAVPLPPAAQQDPTTDGNLVVWQPATDTLWEFWKFQRAGDAAQASWGGRLQAVSTGSGNFTGNLGASASGLPLVGGLILPHELQSGQIDHVLTVGIPTVRAGVYSLPALRTDGRSECPRAIPEGARFRLDPSVNVDSLGLPPIVATLARAAQRYGIIVRDRSSAVAFAAQHANSLPSNPYPALFGGRAPYELLQSFPWEHLQLLRMDLRRVPGHTPPPLSGVLSGC
jgi:hypothetical protein